MEIFCSGMLNEIILKGVRGLFFQMNQESQEGSMNSKIVSFEYGIVKAEFEKDDFIKP